MGCGGRGQGGVDAQLHVVLASVSGNECVTPRNPCTGDAIVRVSMKMLLLDVIRNLVQVSVC